MYGITSYDFLHKIYENVNTIIFCVLDVKDQKKYALKILKSDRPSEQEIERMRHEVLWTQRCEDSPRIRKAIRYEILADRHCLLLEYIEGKSLSELMSLEMLSFFDKLKISLEWAQALKDLADKDVIHRDVKPSNLIVDKDLHTIHLIDLGLSMAADALVTTGLQSKVAGTWLYMSPEQTGRMHYPTDHRSDQYSLGISFYELFVGIPPFKSLQLSELIYAHLAITPEKPHLVRTDLPEILSSIILKMLAKSPEKRYQSFEGLIWDLQECLRRFTEKGVIDPFTIASRDFIGTFEVSRELFGRDEGLKILYNSYFRSYEGGVSRVFIEGEVGSGKTDLIEKVCETEVHVDVWLLKARFDPDHKLIPYFGFSQILKGLSEIFLQFSESELVRWRTQLHQELKENLSILGKISPDFVRVLEGGKPSPFTESPDESGFRFVNTIRIFFKILLENRKLILWYDNFQWVDPGSLKILQILFQDVNLQNVLFLGTLRSMDMLNNELDKWVHTDTLKQITEFIKLSPLTKVDLEDWILASFKGYPMVEPEKLSDLADLLYKKTAGNPYFFKLFLQQLAEQKLLSFQTEKGGWNWNLPAIRMLKVTENAADIILLKVNEISEDSQEILRTAAVIGDSFSGHELLATEIHFNSEVLIAITEAVKHGLLQPSSVPYLHEDGESLLAEVRFAFTHNRLHTAFYDQVSEEHRMKVHKALGIYYAELSAKTESQHEIFVSAFHLNKYEEFCKGGHMDSSLTLARFHINSKAASIAVSQAAYDQAHFFISKALPFYVSHKETLNSRQRYEFSRIDLILAYQLNFKDLIDEKARVCLNECRSIHHTAGVYAVCIEAWMHWRDYRKVIEYGREFLRSQGFDLPKKALIPKLILNIIKLIWAVKTYKVEDFEKELYVSDIKHIAILKVALRLNSSLLYTDPMLFMYAGIEEFLISRKKGNNSYIAGVFTSIGPIVHLVLKDLNFSTKVGKIAFDTLNRFESEVKHQTLIAYIGILGHLSIPLRQTLKPLLQAHEEVLRIGDNEYASNSLVAYISNIILTGDPLPQISQILNGLEKRVNTYQLSKAAINLKIVQELTEALQKDTFLDGDLTGYYFDSEKMLSELVEANDYNAIGLYSTLFMKYLFIQGKYEEILTNPLLKFSQVKSRRLLASHFVYLVMKLISICRVMNSKDRWRKFNYRREVKSRMKEIQKYVSYCPEDKAAPFALLQAEWYRAENNVSKALFYYNEAIELSKKYEKTQWEGIANDSLGSYYLEMGMERQAGIIFTDARYCFDLWGCRAKVLSIEKEYAHLLRADMAGEYRGESVALSTAYSSTMSRTSVVGSASLGMDSLTFSRIINASKNIASEVKLHALLELVMQTLLEVSGAEYAAYIQKDQELMRLLSYANSKGTFEVCNLSMEDASDLVPTGLIRFAIRSSEVQTLQTDEDFEKFRNESYFRKHNTESCIAIPLISRGRCIGVLYIDNSLRKSVWDPARMEALSFLTGQLAISLEHANMYENLEAKVQSRSDEIIKQNSELEEQKWMLERKNKHIHDSLRYGKTIQQAILPHQQMLNSFFKDSGIVYLPKDMVSGDFYWFHALSDHQALIAVVDCTGHGVPGAFMSMIGTMILNQIVIQNQVYNPSKILDEMDRRVRFSLHQEETGNNDGMDACLCLVDTSQKLVKFAGAKRPLFHIRANEVIEHSGTRRSLGGQVSSIVGVKDFETMEIPLEEGDALILCSDGFVDQNNVAREKVGKKRFFSWLTEGASQNGEGFARFLEWKLAEFSENVDQRDDISLVILKI